MREESNLLCRFFGWGVRGRFLSLSLPLFPYFQIVFTLDPDGGHLMHTVLRYGYHFFIFFHIDLAYGPAAGYPKGGRRPHVKNF